MTEREKIIKIIEKWAERTITTRVWGAGVYDPYNAAELADALTAAGIGDVTECKHRAEVAERALLLMARGECTFAPPEFYKEEAEREVAEEEQIMANCCGEGKCEYFESIRRAANNNREYGYCKKYKQDLHLYDWWWLKCDECTAEKEIAEEKGE